MNETTFFIVALIAVAIFMAWLVHTTPSIENDSENDPTDWLSGHEAIVNEAQPGDDDMLIFTTAEGRRMARVLRELAEEFQSAVVNMCLQCSLHHEILSDLSDDAKALIKQEEQGERSDSAAR